MAYSKLSYILKSLLVASALLHVVGAASGWLELQLLGQIASNTAPENLEQLAEASDNRQFWIGLVQIIAFIAAMVVSLRWIYGSNKLAQSRVQEALKFTAGWSVGWYFVPIMNFWKPYQVMREIWLSSADQAAGSPDKDIELLGFWWFAFLVNSFVGRIAFRLSLRAETIDELLNSSKWMLASDITGFIGTLVFLAVVIKISSNFLSPQLTHDDGSLVAHS